MILGSSGFDWLLGGPPMERTALFRAFRAPVGTHVKMSAWTASGDFRARFLLVIPTADGIYRFASGSDAMARFGINVVGGVGSVVTAQIDGVWESANNKSLTSGQLTLFEYERINSVFTIRVNSVEKHTSTSSVAPVMLDQLFVDNNGISNHFDGYALLTYLQDLSTPSNSRRYSRFCEPSGIVPNDLSVLGAELSFTASQITGDWLNDGDGSYSYTGSLNEAVLDDSKADGQRFRIGYTVSGSTVGRVEWKPGSGPTESFSEGNGRHQALVTADSVGLRFTAGFANGGRFDGTVSDIVIREDDDSGVLYNPADGSIQRHTKKSGYWLGRDILSGIYPDEVHAPWVPHGAAFSIDGSQAAAKSLWWGNVLTSNGQYRCVINVSESTAGGVRPENADINIPFPSGNGRFEFDFTTNSNTNFNIQAGASLNGTVTFSLMPLIQIAEGAL